MVRISKFLMLLALMLFIDTNKALASFTPATGPSITLTGILEYHTNLSIPHYQVRGFTLLHKNLVDLKPLLGTEVIVTGKEVDSPSIFMRKLLLVERIETRNPNSGAPIDNKKPVTIPATPDPAEVVLPPENKPISIPVPPIPYFGTAFHLLFGHIEQLDGRYFLVDNRPDEVVKILVTSYSVDLSNLVGKQVGAVGLRRIISNGEIQYVLRQAMILSGDLSERIQTDGFIYVAPKGKLTVKLRGRIIEMEQPPIIGNGRTLVAMRSIAEALGAEVHWNGTNQTATVRLHDREVTIKIGTNRVILRHKHQTEITIINDIAPVIMSGRTMVPLRVLSEGLGLDVNWNAHLRQVELQ